MYSDPTGLTGATELVLPIAAQPTILTGVTLALIVIHVTVGRGPARGTTARVEVNAILTRTTVPAGGT
jgi:hypothetical protein